MTDRDRAERALARAFSEHADEVDFEPFDPEALIAQADGLQAVDTEDEGPGRSVPTSSQRRRPWVQLAAAAIVLVVAAPIVGVVYSMFNAQSSAPSAVPAAAPGDSQIGNRQTRPEAAGGATGGSSDGLVPPLPSGWREESMLDAVVRVPADWGYGFAPGSDWCGEPGHQREIRPFVQRNPLSQAERAISCTDDMPDGLRQTHLTWRPAKPGDGDGVVAVGKAGTWFHANRVVGSAFVTVEVPTDDLALAEKILDSARVASAGLDPRGCPVVRPEGSPDSVAVADLATASEAVVCQYTVGPDAGPNLVGSYALTGAEAQGVLDAVRAAPVSTAQPHPSCGPVGNWLVVRFDGGDAEVRLQVASCGQFVLDDGETARTPTRATCGDLLVGPLWVPSFDGPAAAVCAPR